MRTARSRTSFEYRFAVPINSILSQVEVSGKAGAGQRVAKATMLVDGVDVFLSPGMTVTAEVTTGTRRLIDYVLSPVMQHVEESGRER
jgi:hypothetical protein